MPALDRGAEGYTVDQRGGQMGGKKGGVDRGMKGGWMGSGERGQQVGKTLTMEDMQVEGDGTKNARFSAC